MTGPSLLLPLLLLMVTCFEFDFLPWALSVMRHGPPVDFKVG